MLKKFLFILLALCALQFSLAKAMEAQQDTPSKNDLELLNRKLFEAIDSGDCEQVRDLIRAKADVNAWSKKWELTPLAYAACWEKEEICKLLIAAKADVNLKNSNGSTALMRADNAGICKLLIDAGACVNHQSKRKGLTKLMCAAMHDRPEICQVLIDAGADINRQDNTGNTALIWAAALDRARICKLLIEAGADVYMIDQEGGESTALMCVPEDWPNRRNLPAKMQIIELILGATAQLEEHDKRSILNWFLVCNRLQQQGRGLNKDLTRLIARTIHLSLAQDLHDRAIRAGAAKTLALAQEKNLPELMMQLEAHLNMHELEKIVRKQTWPYESEVQTARSHIRKNQLQRSTRFRNLRAMMPPEQENQHENKDDDGLSL